MGPSPLGREVEPTLKSHISVLQQQIIKLKNSELCSKAETKNPPELDRTPL